MSKSANVKIQNVTGNTVNIDGYFAGNVVYSSILAANSFSSNIEMSSSSLTTIKITFDANT